MSYFYPQNRLTGLYNTSSGLGRLVLYCIKDVGLNPDEFYCVLFFPQFVLRCSYIKKRLKIPKVKSDRQTMKSDRQTMKSDRQTNRQTM